MDDNYAEYLLNKTIQDYNLIADDFSSKRKNPWPETKFLFDDYLAAGEKILDLGCGNGRFFELVKGKEVDYFGVDPSEKLIEIAKSSYPQAKFQTTKPLRISFPNNFFDKIYSIAVLHHIPSKEYRIKFLTEAKRVLKPGGLLIVVVWKAHKLGELLLILKYAILRVLGISRLDFFDVFEPWGKITNRYYHFFSKKELINLLKETGFEVLETGLIKNERGNRQNIYLVARKSP